MADFCHFSSKFDVYTLLNLIILDDRAGLKESFEALNRLVTEIEDN